MAVRLRIQEGFDAVEQRAVLRDKAVPEEKGCCFFVDSSGSSSSERSYCSPLKKIPLLLSDSYLYFQQQLQESVP